MGDVVMLYRILAHATALMLMLAPLLTIIYYMILLAVFA